MRLAPPLLEATVHAATRRTGLIRFGVDEQVRFRCAGAGRVEPDHLACASGASNKDVAARLGSTAHTVGRWQARFVEHRIAGLDDLPGSGGQSPTYVKRPAWPYTCRGVPCPTLPG